MKLTRILFAFIIGMMMFTNAAFSSDIEKNQKTELVKEFTLVPQSVYDYHVAPVLTGVASEKVSEVKSFTLLASHVTYLAIITDVGWRSSQGKFAVIQNKEKLRENSKNDLKFYKNSNFNRIRENPFAVNHSYSFKRYC